MSFIIATVGWLLVVIGMHYVVYRRWASSRLGSRTAIVASAASVASLPLLMYLAELAVHGMPIVDLAATLLASSAMLVGGLFFAGLFFAKQ